MSRSKFFADESPFLQGESIFAVPEVMELELPRIESPFLSEDVAWNFLDYSEEARFENDATAPDPKGLRTFDSKTFNGKVAVLVSQAARNATRVEVLVFFHGLDRCDTKSTRAKAPGKFITDAPFKLGEIVEASMRPIVLVVPSLQWGKGPHELGQPKKLNALIAEAVPATPVGVSRLILAGHSRAYDVLNPLARAHGDPAMSQGALACPTHVWAFDTAYNAPVADWEAWLRSRDDLNVTVAYRDGESCEGGRTMRLPTGVHGAKFRSLQKRTALALKERFNVIPVPSNVVSHCDVPVEYLPIFLRSLPGPVLAGSSAPQREWFMDEDEEFEESYGEEHEDETEDAGAYEVEISVDEDGKQELYEEPEEAYEPYGYEFEKEEDEEPEQEDDGEVSMEEEDYADEEAGTLESSGLTPAQRKAVEITSTFETGRRGGFFGLSGDFDGQGISFGLVNWNIGTGSLQPLLRDFASEQPVRWKTVFGPDAATFWALIAPKGREAVAAQLRFAKEQMNVSRIVKGKRKWLVTEPWLTYFTRLSEDTEFQRVQVRYVRHLLDRARYFCEYFGLTSEMSFAFMFDAVSSHGKGWLTKKWNGVEKRRVQLRARLATLEAAYGKGMIPESELLLAIADVLADTSLDRWREKVRIRKRWFVTGEHPRAAELKGLTPRPDVSYLTGAPVSAPPGEAPMGQEEFETALHQATHAGSENVRTAIAATLREIDKDLPTWFGEIITDATFLGVQIRASQKGKVHGVHRSLFDVLQRAERNLLGSHPGHTAKELGRDLGVRSIGGLRPPSKATGGEAPSLHCFGLAIDINPGTNPFIGYKKADKKSPRYKELLTNRSPRIIERAMRLLRGESFNVEIPLPTTSVGAAWDLHHLASETLAEYLRLADDPGGEALRNLVARAQSRGDTESLSWWQNRIATDRKYIPNWDFPSHPNPQQLGYMDLRRELVVALVGAGLRWGGQYDRAKDIMHFELANGPIRKRAQVK